MTKHTTSRSDTLHPLAACRAFPAASEKFFLLRDLVKTPTQPADAPKSSGPSSSSSVEALPSHRIYPAPIPKRESR
ncbi:hypothetical protein FALCPG4_004498 [Fusarium falciforme]